MKKSFLFALVAAPFLSMGQSAPSKANVIIAHGVGFLQVCNALLDSGFTIETKDNDLMTVATAGKRFPNGWSATYKLSVRVKDSSAFISGTFSAGGLAVNDPIKNYADKHGDTKTGSFGGYAFLLMEQFAAALSRNLTYEIR